MNRRGKSHLKAIATIYAAHVVDSSTDSGANSNLFTGEELEIFCDELRKIATKLTHHPLNLGSLDKIISYMDENYKTALK